MQLALLAAGELTWVWAWNHALGIATLRANIGLLPFPLLALVLVLGAAARVISRTFPRPSLTPAALAAGGLTLLLSTAEAVWWEGAGGAWPWDFGWIPLTNDSLLLRGLAAGGLTYLTWWRGAALPWPLPTLSRVENSFRVWMQALGALFILTAAARDQFAPLLPALTVAALLPLGAGLVGMPLARVFDIRRERDPDGQVPARVGGQWGWILGTSVTALLVSALLLARALAAGTLTSLMRWLEGPAGAVGGSIDALLAWWAEVWAWLMRSSAEEGIGIDGPGSGSMRAVPVTQLPVREGSGDLDWLMSLVSAVAAAVLLLLLWQLLSRAKERIGVRVADDGVDEERDFVWPSLDSSFGLDSLNGLLAGLRRRRRARRRARQTTTNDPSERVRRLYRQMLHLGERAGRPRDPDETPREYQGALRTVPRFTTAGDELETVTALYSRVRYAEMSPAQDDVSAGERAVRRIRAKR